MAKANGATRPGNEGVKATLARMLDEAFVEAENGSLWGRFGVEFTTEAGKVRTVRKIVDSTVRDFAPVDGKAKTD